MTVTKTPQADEISLAAHHVAFFLDQYLKCHGARASSPWGEEPPGLRVMLDRFTMALEAYGQVVAGRNPERTRALLDELEIPWRADSKRSRAQARLTNLLEVAEDTRHLRRKLKKIRRRLSDGVDDANESRAIEAEIKAFEEFLPEFKIDQPRS